jgi:hypothetical protein
MNEFSIYCTFDIDQDFDPGSVNYYNRTEAKFSSFKEGFSRLLDILDNDPFSVFIRADYQIRSIYGTYSELLDKNPDLIKKINDFGGELNWHVHIYKEENNDWIQVKEEDEITEQFLRDFSEVKKISEINCSIVRIGECTMNNKLMNAINNTGALIDSTALPGRIRNDEEKSFDWSVTGNHPYRPSVQDYRLPGDFHHSVMEVPMTTVNMKASYDSMPVRRYFNLSFRTEVLFQNIEDYVSSNNSIVTITHPFEVLGNGKHDLISFNIDTFSNNLKRLKEIVLASGKKPVFRKISQIIQI